MSSSSNKRLLFLLGIVSVNLVFAAQQLSFATPEAPIEAMATEPTDMVVVDGALVSHNALPQLKAKKAPVNVRLVSATAYTSAPEETDDTPFITASGSVVRFGVAASNVLPLGTKFRMPKLFGDQTFVIEDRMNSIYDGKDHVDLWFEHKSEALQFGRKLVQIEII